jgi:enoyl-CoA hydratase/carnithine racemase
VNGFALGGGMELALACDIVVASENAIFALPEPRVGTAAIAGGLQRLPRQIGLKHAMGMLLTGRQVPAVEAARLGFINEVVPFAGLREAAMRWAESICECSPLAIRAAKQAVGKGLAVSLPEAMQRVTRLPAVRELFDSEDFQEGPRAFAEKRKPRWS